MNDLNFAAFGTQTAQQRCCFGLITHMKERWRGVTSVICVFLGGRKI